MITDTPLPEVPAALAVDVNGASESSPTNPPLKGGEIVRLPEWTHR